MLGYQGSLPYEYLNHLLADYLPLSMLLEAFRRGSHAGGSFCNIVSAEVPRYVYGAAVFIFLRTIELLNMTLSLSLLMVALRLYGVVLMVSSNGRVKQNCSAILKSAN